MLEVDNRDHLQAVNDVRMGEVSSQSMALDRIMRPDRMLCAGFVKLSRQIVYYKETTSIQKTLLQRNEE